MHYAETFLTHWIFRVALLPLVICSCSTLPHAEEVSYPDTPEALVRAMFHANETKNIADLEQLVSRDPDMIGYTIGGRKYVGWDELKREMQQEFETATRVDIPIKEIRVWERGDLAWYTAEIDYVHYEGIGEHARKTVLPLRESGVLERRQGRWLLVQWHESLERDPTVQLVETQNQQSLDDHSVRKAPVDLSGEWEIQEADKTYHAVLDKSGSGNYTWQDGTFTTTRLTDGRWEGVWIQPGNDREGGFEVDLSEDRMAAHGRWWYTRVGNRSNIPARQWGGEYRLKRTQATSANHSLP